MDFSTADYKKIIILLIAPIAIASCGKASHFSLGDSAEKWDQAQLANPDPEEHEEVSADEFENNINLPGDLQELGCARASSAQLRVINKGNVKKGEFLNYCLGNTGNSNWCQQLVRPNPDSKSIFNCTYGSAQAHQLIYPEKNIWAYAIGAVQLVQKLQQKGLRICEIYNWWRPEPYNKNVGGAAGRHPFGTSVDVRFCSSSDAIKGFDELCKYRKQGLIRAIGYYGGTGVHFGVGDKTANTWGRSCR